jgi:4-hydroxyphenylacetate 3-monooxygenase
MANAPGIGREVPTPELTNHALLVIGYAGRDQASVQHHIDELAAIGIAPPPHVPMVYDLSPDLVTYESVVTVSGARSSGEVEPVLVRAAGAWYLALGSDHTDRELEAADVKTSKAVCPKPVSRTAIRLDGDPAAGGLDAAWDAIGVTSEIDGVAYQRGTLASLRVPSDLIAHAVAAGHTGDLVIFCGTVPLLDGAFRYGARFSAAMGTDQWSPLRLEYTVQVQPGSVGN